MVKVAGPLLLRMREGELLAYDVSGDEPSLLSTTRIDDARGNGCVGDPGGELLLVGGRAVVLGTSPDGLSRPRSRRSTCPTRPRRASSTPPPSAAARRPCACTATSSASCCRPGCRSSTSPTPTARSARSAPAAQPVAGPRHHAVRLAADRRRRAAGRLRRRRRPRRRRASRSAPPPSSPSTPRRRPSRTTTAVATDSDTSYFSTDRFYLAAGGPHVGHVGRLHRLRRSVPGTVPTGTTPLYAFALDGAETTYVASGEVEGTIADRWSMDAVGGSLRVAVGPSSETGNFNSVRHPARGRLRRSSRTAGSTTSASTSRSSRCGGSTTSRSW